MMHPCHIKYLIQTLFGSADHIRGLLLIEDDVKETSKSTDGKFGSVP